MDTLEILRRAEEAGGLERRKAISHIIRYARDNGCDFSPGGGKVGGFNIRYGSLGLAILDVLVDGSVYIHLNPDSRRTLEGEVLQNRNKFIEELEGLSPKNKPIQNYGQVEETIETIPYATLEQFVDFSVGHIKETFYR